METVQLFVLLVIGVIGGLMHAFFAPRETAPAQLVVRVAAGVIVVLIYGPIMLVEMTSGDMVMTFAVMAPAMLSTAYFGIEILKALVSKSAG